MREPDWQTEGVKLWCGDALELLPQLPESSIDAIVTDPPYSSGGAFRGDRTQKAIDKYVRTESRGNYSDFTGDTRDQRAFLAWCSLWLCAARYACGDGAVLCSFIDWRQLPIFTDAVQCGGWVWRNVATWWKPGCRMQRGRFSSSAEYVVYATNGPHDSDGECSPQNVMACASLSSDDKDHIAEKPQEVADWLVGVTRPAARVLDPFMGSGAFGVACVKSGRQFAGFDNDPRSFELACRRIEAELRKTALLEPVPKIIQRSLLGDSA
jgi:site-specific DNA-methyltransferase (adenine-specific)